MKLESGSRVNDYVLLDRIGAGAFGEVWKAVHVHLPRVAAIKFATSEAAAHALAREGVAQFGLDHPGIVQVLDASLEAEPPFVVLEYVEGKSLRQLLRERGRFEIQDVSTVFRQLADAVAFAHRKGVLHGDVKPENILVQEQGVHKIVKLTDFQLGAQMAGDRPSTTGPDGLRLSLKTVRPQGTYHYLAPEQELGEAIDARADLFALGVVLFEMATGTLPQGRDLPSDLNPALSWWWDHIFSRCYTGRERRYPDADALLRDIKAAETGPAWGEMPSQRRAAAMVMATAETPTFKQVAAPASAFAPSCGRLASAMFCGLLAVFIPMFVVLSVVPFVPTSRCVKVTAPDEMRRLADEYYRVYEARQAAMFSDTEKYDKRLREIREHVRKMGYQLQQTERGDWVPEPEGY